MTFDNYTVPYTLQSASPAFSCLNPLKNSVGVGGSQGRCHPPHLKGKGPDGQPE